jgi:alpha-tubulin suppressor-like RCC1 family protein
VPARPIVALTVMLLTSIACREGVDAPTAPQADPPAGASSRAAAAAVPAFAQIDAGWRHTCGIATGGEAYCWGAEAYGQLGIGPASPGTGLQLTPVPVVGGHLFERVTAGRLHTCALTADGRAYCWGRNAHGQLGDGTFRDRRVPVAVSGGLRFRVVSAGDYHTCGVTLGDRAYCWGRNDQGRLGDGTAGLERPRPTPVAGNLRFLQVAAGGDHSCGVTVPPSRVYCWGANFWGQLGAGEVAPPAVSLTPLRTASGRRFLGVSAGDRFTCAVTTDNRGFCWGYGKDGQIGDGKDYVRFAPTAVTGSHAFRQIAAGGRHACGVTTDGQAYCWGWNLDGQLGAPAEGFRQPVPLAVAGGLAWASVAAGTLHTCGIATSGRAYCWGYNTLGELGDGTTEARHEPTPVGGTAPGGQVLLSLGFDGTLVGEDGEQPTTSEGITFEPGVSGSGVLIQGSDRLAYASAGNFTAESGTIELWIKPRWNGTDGTHRFFFSLGNQVMLLKDGADNLRFLLRSDDSEAHQYYSLLGWSAGEWHQVAATWTVPGVMTTYVDGVPVISHDAGDQDRITEVPAELFVGRFESQFGSYPTGSPAAAVIDEVRISDYARSAEEIAASFRRGMVP